MLPSPRSLTPKEKAVLEFLEHSLLKLGVCPSYQEICQHFGLASFNSVQNYLKQLVIKGYIQVNPHQKRSIQLLSPSSSVEQHLKIQHQRPSHYQRGIKRNSIDASMRAEAFEIPLLGKVAAGLPLEAITHDEWVTVPSTMVKSTKSTYALQVSGLSMKDDGIFDGDILIVHRQNHADNGKVVIARIGEESTVKRFYTRRRNGDRWIELKPANSEHKPQWYPADQVTVEGVVIGLVRQFL